MRIACWFICFVLASSSLALAQTAFKNATNDWLMLSGVSQTSAIRRRAPTDAAARCSSTSFAAHIRGLRVIRPSGSPKATFQETRALVLYRKRPDEKPRTL